MKKKRYSYRVMVTYGTIPHMTYARVPSRDSAEKLKQTAIGLGYRDARVVEEVEEYDEPSPSVGEDEEKERGGEKRPYRPRHEAR